MNDNNLLQERAAHLKKPSLVIQTSPVALRLMDRATETPSAYLSSPATPNSGNLSVTPTAHALCTPDLLRRSSLTLATPFREPGEAPPAFSVTPSISSASSADTIRLASHESLLQNELYRSLLSKNHELNETILVLNHTMGELQGRYNEQRTIYESLIERWTPIINGGGNSAERHSSSDIVTKAPHAQDHPLCKFWMRDQWTPYSQGGDLYHQRNADNKVLKYLEDRDGNVITKVRVAEMAELQRSLWEKYRKEGRMPLKWSQADREVIVDHRTEMYQNFPELSLCDSHWKLKQFASQNYPSWIRKYRPGDAGGSDASQLSECEDVQQEHVTRVPKRTHPPGPHENAMRKIKRSKSRSTSQHPVATQMKSAFTLEAGSSGAPLKPSDLPSTLLGIKATTAHSVPPACSTTPPHLPSLPPTPPPAQQGSILKDVQRRQSLLAKLCENDQGLPECSEDATGGSGPVSPALPHSNAAPKDLFAATPSSMNDRPLMSSALPSTSEAPPPIPVDPIMAAGSMTTSMCSSHVKISKLRVSKSSTTARLTRPGAQHSPWHFSSVLYMHSRQRFALAYTARDPGATVDILVDAFEMAAEDEVKIYRDAVVAAHGGPKDREEGSDQSKRRKRKCGLTWGWYESTITPAARNC
ncbi:hypothetical protein NUW54_g6583 [Trametes sanguinea]|uniref:Uncharacterized protein n=1 Tax=Trametes sanguinea TaxID=158606 RepID=A0ACC1PTP1_9APHY|nr:hypothetical protein NUW54_g6583 [Trametes sanguinea]